MRVKAIDGIPKPIDQSKKQLLKAVKAGFVIITTGNFRDQGTDIKAEGLVLYDNGVKDIIDEHSYDSYFPLRNFEVYSGELTISND